MAFDFRYLLNLCGAVYALSWAMSPVWAETHNLYSATIIGPHDVSYIDATVNINDSLLLTIQNGASISGTINVLNGYELQIKNAGMFKASVNSGASVTQIIETDDDITTLENIGINYSVFIKNDTSSDMLDLNKITENTPGANKYNLEDAKLRLNHAASLKNVKASGTVIVDVAFVPDSEVLLFEDLTGTVNVVSSDVGSLYFIKTRANGGKLYVYAERSSDYGRILNNNTGNFLNSLREKSPDDKLFIRLDSTRTFDDLNDVMGKSIRIHPIKMMQSVRTIYSHKSLEIMHIARDDGAGIMPIYVFSSDMRALGAEPYINLDMFDDLHVKLTANILNIKYSDDINAYGVMSYGIGADVIYDFMHDNFVRLYGGANLSSFDSGIVFNGNGAKENPNGWSGYMIGEVGHRFNFDDSYYISPFVSVGGDWATILNTQESNYFGGAGMNAGFNFEFDGFRYDYALRGIGRTDGTVGGELNVSIWSLTDSAGAGLRGGMLYNDTDGASYHIALDVGFNF